MNKKNPGNQIEDYIKSKSEEEFKKIMEGRKEADNISLLLLGMSRLFGRMDDLKDTMGNGFERMEKVIRNSMYPIWISIIIGIITYIIINVFGA